MKIKEINIYRLTIPFRHRFSHSVAQRDSTDNIIVEVILKSGIKGYGEGIPRQYVGGKTSESTVQLLRTIDFSFLARDFHTVEELISLLEGPSFSRPFHHAHTINNAAKCALELALLDTMGKHFNISCSDAIRNVLHETQGYTWKAPGRVRYSAVISGESLPSEVISALKMKLFGFTHFKLKVGFSPTRDVRKVSTIRNILGSAADIRVDANGSWSLEHAREILGEMKRFNISVAEQPLAKGETDKLVSLRNTVDIPLMLDESLCDMEDAFVAHDKSLCSFFNIRISKCGGLLDSIKMARFAREHGIRYQLGCQVGETGLLSAAGRHFATHVPGVIYLEGSYDRFLLSDNITAPDITFGYGGWAAPLQGAGLGVEVDENKLSRYGQCVVNAQF